MLLLLIFIAFFAACSKAAFSAPERILLWDGEENGQFALQPISFIRSHFSLFSISVRTVLIASYVATIIMGQQMLETHLHECWQWPIAAVLALTASIIVLGIIPYELFGKRDTNTPLKIMAWPTAALFAVASLPVYALSLLAGAVLRFFNIPDGSPTQNDKEGHDLERLLRMELELGTTENVDEEVKMLHNALELSDVLVKECALPRTEIVYVDRTESEENLLRTFIESGKSKVIVCDDDLDHILGYVHSATMFERQHHWTSAISTMPCVPEQMPASRLLRLLMQEKRSLAVVVDEFGGTTGIVSIEDIIEEILGDIQDEHDFNTYTARRTADDEYVLSARIEVDQVNEQFNLHLPESEDYITLAGLILAHFQRMPHAGEVVRINSEYSFKILKTTPRKIELVRLKKTTT